VTADPGSLTALDGRALPSEPSAPPLADVAEPRILDYDAVLARLGDPRLVLLEVDEQPLLYRMRHIPGAHMLDWHDDLQDPVTRDLPDPAAMRRLWARVGIGEESFVVLYGDKYNLYACFAYWVFWLYGLRQMAILDGGRTLWLSRRLPTETREPEPRDTDAPAAQFDPTCRAAWWQLRERGSDGPSLSDVRTPQEYTGEVLAEAGYPGEVAQRPGHIPGAANVPWTTATEYDGRLKPRSELERLYASAGVKRDRPVISYCRIGERSAHTWFVLHELLGHPNVRNYDGSWTEWGSMVGMPIALGDEPGELPAQFPMTRGLTAP
jgi:thiosulfate/3-mercaptopyruvate sulfurtransferase